MRNSVPWAAALAAAVVVAAPAAGQDEAPAIPIGDVLEPLRPADLAGEAWFGLYRHGKSVGTLRLTVAAEGPGVTVRVSTAFTLEGVRLSLEEEARLAGPLSPVRLRQVTREADAPAEEVTAEREGDEVVVREGEHRWRAGAADLLVGQAGRLVLALALQRSAAPAGRHEVQELSLEHERARPLEVRVEVPAERPAERRIVMAPVADPADAWELLTDGEGLAAFGRRGDAGLVYLRAKDEGDARRDRPGLGQPPPGSPRGVVLEYLRGLVRGDAARVEAAIDWSALFDSLGAADAHPDVEAFKRSFLDGLARAKDELELEPDDVDALGPALTEALSPDGARAWVTIPGEDHRVRLGRAGPGGAWKIQSLVE